MSDITIPYCKY